MFSRNSKLILVYHVVTIPPTALTLERHRSLAQVSAKYLSVRRLHLNLYQDMHKHYFFIGDGIDKGDSNKWVIVYVIENIFFRHGFYSEAGQWRNFFQLYAWISGDLVALSFASLAYKAVNNSNSNLWVRNCNLFWICIYLWINTR